MYVDGQVLVDRPVDGVFGFVADFSRLPDWAEPVVEREVLTEGPLGVGTRVRAVDEFSGRRVEFFEEITVWEPNDRVTVHMGRPMNGDVSFVFESAGRGTRLTGSMDAKPSGLMGLVTRLLRRKVEQGFRKDLQTLKTLIEAEPER